MLTLAAMFGIISLGLLVAGIFESNPLVIFKPDKLYSSSQVPVFGITNPINIVCSNQTMLLRNNIFPTKPDYAGIYYLYPLTSCRCQVEGTIYTNLTKIVHPDKAQLLNIYGTGNALLFLDGCLTINIYEPYTLRHTTLNLTVSGPNLNQVGLFDSETLNLVTLGKYQIKTASQSRCLPSKLWLIPFGVALWITLVLILSATYLYIRRKQNYGELHYLKDTNFNL